MNPLHAESIVIDGLIISKWNRPVFEDMRRGGLTAANCTVSVWDDFKSNDDDYLLSDPTNEFRCSGVDTGVFHPGATLVDAELPPRPRNSARSPVHAVCRPPRSAKAMRPGNPIADRLRAKIAPVSASRDVAMNGAFAPHRVPSTHSA